MARLYEYKGKEILNKGGIRIPQGKCVESIEEAKLFAKEINRAVVLKAQVLATGRFSAGGIRFAKTDDEVEKAAHDLFGAEIKDLKVEKLLIEEQIQIEKEFYAGVIVSNSYKVKGPIFIFSSEGGTSVEDISTKNPERVTKLKIDYLKGLDSVTSKYLLSSVVFNGNELSEKVLEKLSENLLNIYKTFTQYDCRSLEINPLVLTKDGSIIAADCHMSIDDNSVFKHPELGIELPRDMDRPPTKLEKKAWKIEEGDYRGTGYFAQMAAELRGEGWIGFHGIGGGGAMLGASAFVLKGLKIANYADTSGDPPASKVYKVIKCILSQPIDGYVLMGSCLANQELWHHAHALVKAFKEEAENRLGFPVLILIGGNKEKETHEIIKEGFQNLPFRWELYGRDYIYDTDFICDRMDMMVKEYQLEKKRRKS